MTWASISDLQFQLLLITTLGNYQKGRNILLWSLRHKTGPIYTIVISPIKNQSVKKENTFIVPEINKFTEINKFRELIFFSRTWWDFSGCECWWLRHPYPQKAGRHISPIVVFKPQAGKKFQQSWSRNSCHTLEEFGLGSRSRDGDLPRPKEWYSVA